MVLSPRRTICVIHRLSAASSYPSETITTHTRHLLVLSIDVPVLPSVDCFPTS